MRTCVFWIEPQGFHCARYFPGPVTYQVVCGEGGEERREEKRRFGRERSFFFVLLFIFLGGGNGLIRSVSECLS